MEEPDSWFAAGCTRCPRIATNLAAVREQYPDYHAAPVAPFGDRCARLLIVGLGPGMHGANRTGRPFTGDYAGILLYETLYEHGLASRPVSESADDPLRLAGCRITNAVKCLPPGNKPSGSEVRACNDYLAAELADLQPGSVILALGRIAHDAVLAALSLRKCDFHFAHGAEHRLPDGRWLVDTYHCSRYNTQTRRLTGAMFSTVVARAAELGMPGRRR